jgi:hypothetical protein
MSNRQDGDGEEKEQEKVYTWKDLYQFESR